MATMISLRRNYTPGGVKMWNRGLMPEYVAYRNRVDADGGDIDSGSLTRKLLKFYKSEGRLSNIKLLWSAVGGTLVQSGTNPVQISKAYSADSLTTHNDLTQTTSLNQPYGVGQIQGLPMGLYNPNGDVRYITHPQISFAANEAWSVTVVLKLDGNAPTLNYVFGESGTNSRVFIYNSSGNIQYNSRDNISKTFVGYYKPYFGKQSILSIVHNGTGGISLYINGVLKEATADTLNLGGFIFNQLFLANSNIGRQFGGSISHYHIQSSALTPAQVLAEYNLLRSIYPEIPSVVIGSQEWAVDNFRAVATPMGNVIPNVTDAAAWAALTTPAWCSYNNDPANDAIYGKIFNGYAKNLLYADMVTALFGWNVATKAQLQAIAALGGDVLRVAGTGYWTTDRGNNSSQFYALGGAMRNADGTFATIKNSATFWAGDAIEAMTIQHDSDTVTVAATALKAGHSIRLTKL